MPPRHLTEATNPGQPEIIDISGLSEQRGRLGAKLGALLSRGTEHLPSPTVFDLDMNVAESYRIQWDAEKCGRDAFQNFFDANDGTLDGVRTYMEKLPTSPNSDELAPTYAVSIEGDADYDFRELTVIGATTKTTGEHTAGGFGEGAKFLALSLLRDHDADRVIYRSRDWQLEFFMGEMDKSKVVRPTRGLFARVATGLRSIDGSAMVVTSKNRETAQSLMDAKQFFRSSENPDFQDNVIEKTLPDGTQTGVKFVGVDTSNKYFQRANKGHLYVAGQRRHYSVRGDKPDSWDTVEGITVWTTKDIAPGDRDRGAVSKNTVKDEVFAPLAESLDEDEVKAFFEAIEPAYPGRLSTPLTEIGMLGELIASRGEQLGVQLDFDLRYVAVTGFLSMDLTKTIQNAGYETCPGYYAKVGMRTHTELLRALHEHQRVEPTPEQQARINLLQEGLGVMTEAETLKKQIEPKEIWLYSKEHEKNPFEGTYDEEFIWLSEEYLERDFASVFAAYLHELDHKSGSDQSAEFSYALTDTLAEVIHAMTTNPDLAHKFQDLTQRWHELTEAGTLQRDHGS